MRRTSVVILVAAIALAGSACTNSLRQTPSAGTSSASVDPEPGQAVAVIVLEKPWMPPWTGPNPPQEIAERAALRFCGVEQGPAIDREIRACFLDSVMAERDIEFARIEPTVEGDRIATVFGFEPPDGFSMAVDSTLDKFGVPGWSVSFCAHVTPDPNAVFRLDRCRDGPHFP